MNERSPGADEGLPTAEHDGLARRCPACGAVRQQIPEYSVSAEFYDVLHGAEYRRSALELAAPAAAARLGIVELGAGTGLVTEVLVSASSVPVHVVEPAAAMRAVLLSRLAAAGPDTLGRVTVHPCPAQQLGLAAQADLAVCLRVIAGLPPVERRSVWHSAATWLLPGGLLLVDRPPRHLPAEPRQRVVGEVRIGIDTYTARLTEHPKGDHVQLDYTYLVRRQGRVIRRAEETFHQWPLTDEELDRELADAGFRLEGEQTPGVLRLRRLDHQDVITHRN
ncbi:class I SAM-dependent methyltransferase [Kitasatospora sp. GP82]|uniref:class I SAM-dependent methyltransferase n=1 Tax=Kitasatospora sp. GP82 TaxID=3035089 RepID=UPI00247716B6|nr:class I SAM-dependent methyltransferase [Kitasatospora sp. GP82]MDH6123993.1 SAM-dependent methyltransferase [Kitasatospora sp. GP82]